MRGRRLLFKKRLLLCFGGNEGVRSTLMLVETVSA